MKAFLSLLAILWNSAFKWVYLSFFPLLSLPFFIMRNAGLEEAQAGIKIAGRNINNLRYADNTTHMAMAKREEELKGFLMKVKRRVKKLA